MTVFMILLDLGRKLALPLFPTVGGALTSNDLFSYCDILENTKKMLRSFITRALLIEGRVAPALVLASLKDIKDKQDGVP